MAAPPITNFDHSVAYSCLLNLFPWYGEADSRDAGYVTDLLVQAWRESVASGSTHDCFTLAQRMESELREKLATVKAERLRHEAGGSHAG